MANELTRKRKELNLKIEATRRELLAVERELQTEGILDDPTLLGAIERARIAYEKGDFTVIRKHASKMMEALEADRFFRVLTKAEMDAYITQSATNPNANMYKFPDHFSVAFRCPYGLPITVGAPPKNRKTSFAINLLYHDTLRDVNSVFCTFELTPEQVFLKTLQVHLRLTHHLSFGIEDMAAIAENGIKEFPKVKPSLDEYRELFFNKVKVVECAGYNAERLCATIDRVLMTHPARVVHIDYFQRIRHRNVTDARLGYMQNSRILTEKCKTLNVLFVILSQMNNDGGFKETGALEEDSGLALTLTAKNGNLEVKIKAARFMQPFDYTLTLDPLSGAFL
jgi:hypothetical protein